MDSGAVSAKVSGAVAIVAVGLTYFLTKRRERDADWRKVRLEYYKEFIAALAGIVQGRATADTMIRFIDALNSVGLVAAPTVMRSIYAFQDEISVSNTDRNQTRHDHLLTAMMKAMRDDVPPGSLWGREPLEFRLIAPLHQNIHPTYHVTN